jgi:hypothetical protein
MQGGPFADPPDLACMTVAPIVNGDLPILLVAHDTDDGGSWQFLSGAPFDVSDGRLVTLASLVRRDRSLLELANLPLRWQAWRQGPDSPWQGAPSETAGA